MATLTLFDEFMNELGKATHALNSHTFKAMLSNVAPDKAANTVKTDITEISAGNGYTAGGATLASVTWLETGAGLGIWRFTAADIVFTASGGSIATHRYLVIYNDTHASDALVGFVDRGSTDVITDGNTRTWDIGASGLFEVDATPVMGATGTADLDFGAFPGKTDASLAITGQAGIASGSLVEAWMRPVDTADHKADEHTLNQIEITAGNIAAGTGFTIYGVSRDATRSYGIWKVAWVWN